MHAFILAGGFATRLWPLTEKRAKPLLPLAGLPILTHIVEKIPLHIPVTVSTNAAFKNGFLEWKETIDRPSLQIMIEPTFADDKKLGTNGAIAQWLRDEKITDDVLLLTGDNYLGFSIENFIASYTGNPLLAAYDIGDKHEARKFGTVILSDDGRSVAAFEEKPAEAKTTLVSTGCYIVPASSFAMLDAYAKTHPDFIGGIFEEFLRMKTRVDCFRFEECWFDIGSFETYLNATKKLVGDHLLLGDGAEMVSSMREGSVVIGQNSKVDQSTITDTVIFDDCEIVDCVLERCVIDSGCSLKGIDLTGKMIRAGTILRSLTR